MRARDRRHQEVRRPAVRRAWFPVGMVLALLLFAPALSHAQSGADTVTVRWTAPGDDGGSGTAVSYDLRYSILPIVDLNTFLSANQVSGEPAPHAAGSAESTAVSLPSGTYYFAIRATDEASNDRGISNVPVIVVP